MVVVLMSLVHTFLHTSPRHTSFTHLSHHTTIFHFTPLFTAFLTLPFTAQLSRFPLHQVSQHSPLLTLRTIPFHISLLHTAHHTSLLHSSLCTTRCISRHSAYHKAVTQVACACIKVACNTASDHPLSGFLRPF